MNSQDMELWLSKKKQALWDLFTQTQPPAPDCRTCHQFYFSQFTQDYHCHFTQEGGVCTNGDQYQPAPSVVLWRTES